MEKRTLFTTLFLVGISSIILLLVGLFAPAWLVYDMNIKQGGEKIRIEIGLGLFGGHACVNSQSIEQCASFSQEDIMKSIDNTPEASQRAVRGLFGSFVALQAMTILAGIASLTGVCCKIGFKRTDNRIYGVVAACMWVVSGALLIAAVGHQASQNHTMSIGVDTIKAMPEVKEMMEFEMHFPWALLVVGIAAALKFLNALIISLYVCFVKQGESVGNWNRFTNQGVVGDGRVFSIVVLNN